MTITRTSIAATALLLLAAAPAAAKNEVDPRVEAALRCMDEASEPVRLRCYDTAMAGIREALATGKLKTEVPGPDDGPGSPEGVIKSVSATGFNRWRVELESGEVWDTIDDTAKYAKPRAGEKVKFKRGAGTYMLVIGYLGVRANRVR